MLKVKLCLNHSLEYMRFECEEVNIQDNKYVGFFNNKEAIAIYPISDITFMHISEVKNNENV